MQQSQDQLKNRKEFGDRASQKIIIEEMNKEISQIDWLCNRMILLIEIGLGLLAIAAIISAFRDTVFKFWFSV